MEPLLLPSRQKAGLRLAKGIMTQGSWGQQVDLGRAIDRSGSDPSEGEFRFNCENDALYVIAMGWPEDGTFHIRALGNSGVYEGLWKQ